MINDDAAGPLDPQCRHALYLMLSKRKLPCEDIKVTFSVLTVDRKKPKLKGPHHSPKI